MKTAVSRLKQSEREFQSAVIYLAKLKGWRVAHFRTSQNARGDYRTAVAADGAGFPDLVLVRDRVIFAELKSETGRLGPAQVAWLDAIANAVTGDPPPCERSVVLATVWRPRDWPQIEEALK